MTLVIDMDRGLRVDHLPTTTPQGHEIIVEVAATIAQRGLPWLREDLLSGVVDSFLADNEQSLFAGYALSNNLHFWEEGVRGCPPFGCTGRESR
ncbi:MAG: hypothetical protein WBE26_13945 [Phycisphaerae bacterium]